MIEGPKPLETAKQPAGKGNKKPSNIKQDINKMHTSKLDFAKNILMGKAFM